MRALRASLLSCVLLAACGPGSDYPGFVPALIPLDGQVLFPVVLGGGDQAFNLAVDTGAARTVVAEELLRDVENGVGVVSIDFGNGVELIDYEVLAADLSQAADHIGVELHGLIGQDIFEDYFFALDYRAARTAMAPLAPADPPPGFCDADRKTVAYELVQQMPIVQVDIGGKQARLIADTGSGVTILTRSFVDQELLADGLTGYVWYTSYGSDPGIIVRLTSLILAGHDVHDSWAVVVPDDYHLKEVFEMLGLQVDGFLGYPVYRRFLIEVNGARSEYSFFRIGCEIMRSGDQVIIDMIFEPSDANQKGLLEGDVLKEIDDQPVAGLDLDEIRLLLRGTPNDVRRLAIGRQGQDIELDIEVDRLLPPL